jgi:hypothetical protein
VNALNEKSAAGQQLGQQVADFAPPAQSDGLSATSGYAGHADFREIAHSGGKVIFRCECDEKGRKRFRVTFTGSRPVPMSMFGVYAMPQGMAVADINLGVGIGRPWNPPPHPACIPVFIASDSEGMFGQECPACQKYWRTGGAANVCAYCRARGERFQFLTSAHLAYVEHYAAVLRKGLDETPLGGTKEVTIDMDAIVDSSADVPKPDFYHPGTAQQTRFRCEKCKTENDIRGRFGYCSSCGWRNNVAELRSQIALLRSDLNDDRVSPEEAVKKIVSAFDACCRDFVAQLSGLPMRDRRRRALQQLLFHGIDAPAELLARAFDIDILKGMDADLGFLRMMFERRHVYEHEAGVATRKYIEESGDTTITEGTLIREAPENAHKLAGCAVRIASNLEAGFHEIFPLEQQE